jgi:hypothetical protein
MKFDDMTDSLSTFNDTTKRLRDPNSDVFPMPKVKKESLSDKVFASNDINKKDVAIEKAIVTRKILRVSAWDRVVSAFYIILLYSGRLSNFNILIHLNAGGDENIFHEEVYSTRASRPKSGARH